MGVAPPAALCVVIESSAVGADPEAVRTARSDGEHGAASPLVGGVQDREGGRMDGDQSGAAGPDPEAAFAILVEKADPVLG